MRNRLLSLLLLASLGGAALPATAGPSILVDMGTGRVLAAEDALQAWHPASLTKLMSAYVTFRAIRAGEFTLKSPVLVTRNAAKKPPAKMGYKPGSVMTLDNALKMMLVKSANDIAVAVAENIAGSEPAFVARMNDEARRLGMSATHFVNPNGLHDPENVTTARDLALLVTAIRTEFPEHAPYFRIEAISDGKKMLKTYNQLIGRFDGADGMKTGFVCASGFNLAGTATRDGRTLIAVVLGAASGNERTEKAAELLARGFSQPARDGTALAALAGPSGSAPDRRDIVCPKPVKQQGEKKPEASEAAGPEKLESPFLHEPAGPPKVILVGLGGAEGTPIIALEPAKAVPIPTPRPVDGPGAMHAG